MDIKMPLLKASQVEVRIGTITEKGVTLLLYKDARVDQQMLDEQFGPFGWKRSHTCINGSIYCTVEVKDPETGEWIGRTDVGCSGQMEKEKSAASDSFKRACVNWGIGRELYSAPRIYISAEKVELVRRNDKVYCNEHFSVGSIEYDENREICGLTILNGKGQCVYRFASKSGNKEDDVLTSGRKEAFESELKRTGIPKAEVYRRYGISYDGDLTEQLYARMMSALKKTKTANNAA